MATIHLSSAFAATISFSLFKSDFSSFKYLTVTDVPFDSKPPTTTKRIPFHTVTQINSSYASPSLFESGNHGVGHTGENYSDAAEARTKTKIVCTIGPSTSSRDMIWKLAQAGMNVARLNMSHGDHASHQRTIHYVNEYNSHFQDKVIAIMLDTKGPEVRSGDVPKPILLKEGQAFNFTIRRGVCTEDTVSVNYDGFLNDVEVGDVLLVDGRYRV